MTGAEIKKAFETMKKELKKELGISGGFTMNKKQMENRTATYLVDNTSTFEDEIAWEHKQIKRVQAFDSWTDEEKERSHKDAYERIANYEAQIEKYGTKENKLSVRLEEIKCSNAFKKFAGNFEAVLLSTEEANGCYYIRFNY